MMIIPLAGGLTSLSVLIFNVPSGSESLARTAMAIELSSGTVTVSFTTFGGLFPWSSSSSGGGEVGGGEVGGGEVGGGEVGGEVGGGTVGGGEVGGGEVGGDESAVGSDEIVGVSVGVGNGVGRAIVG